MASSSATTPETLITLKVNFDGATRRFKLPLRELGVHSLENKLRAFLQIPLGTGATIERYSDSAAAYVLLDSANISVYKQLYRAAKAKQKLKLRVLTQTPPRAEGSTAPKPVSVEDEPETESKEVVSTTSPGPTTDVATPATASNDAGASSEILDTIVAPQTPEDFTYFIDEWRKRGMPRITVRKDASGTEVIDFKGPTSPCEPMVTLEPFGGNTPTQYRFTQTASKLSFSSLILEARAKEQARARPKEDSGIAASVCAGASSHPAEKKQEPKRTESVATLPSCRKPPFTVCCNSCDRPVPDAHYHCSICDDGDFDLCQDCVTRGITCYGDGHWLIKRTVEDGQIKCSTTHIAAKKERTIPGRTIPSRQSCSFSPFEGSLPIRPAENAPAARTILSPTWTTAYQARTCNCCVQEFPEHEFVHCIKCDDYDLCKNCFAKDQHGHHPAHGFTAAVKGTVFESSISSRLAPGRNIVHNAICDGCDTYIRGVRHKCIDCPDWDYCADCVENAAFIHPDHRFVAVYEPIKSSSRSGARSTHFGICCDGPLCSSSQGGSKYIVGVRYKCAVCHDTDFCATCEASPANTHNKTHPLIKFKTPVRHVSVTTHGEHEDGQRLPPMGDRIKRSSSDRSTSPRESIAATPVHTVVDVQPTEQTPTENATPKADAPQENLVDLSDSTPVNHQLPQPTPVHTVAGVQPQPTKQTPTEKVMPKADAPQENLVDLSDLTSVKYQPPQPAAAKLTAIFVRDTVADGTVLPPNHTFEQTWVLRNEGTAPWPAGCSVKFVGGDYMGAIDPTHPAGIHELVSASESTVCYNALKPGQEFPFTVLMRTPDRDGKVISYWRLTTREGVKFGHKLWCDVTVKAPAKVSIPKPVVSKVQVPLPAPEMVKSQMIIPKLEHESPSASLHESQPEPETETESETAAPSLDTHEDDFEDCGEDDDWARDSDDGFMTDEEYDILDASDEEYLSEQQNTVAKK
ncbi:hypothetical protein F4778DRAFT_588234 [Xylariomycetidae sp. FL2044]|nr:hypothetical protein F4778DRAFT_588234 [Xylariomycetidae sp. FL2044]